MPLLPELESGTMTIGCASYTTQPSASSCATSAPAIPTAGGLGNNSSTTSASPTAGGLRNSNTSSAIPTAGSLRNSNTSSAIATAGGPGNSSTSSSSVAGGSQISGASSNGSPGTSQQLPSGASVEVGSIGTAVYTEVFVPTVDPKFSSLTGTVTTTTFDAQSQPVTLVIGPGGAEWTPINLPQGEPELNPPVNPPVNPNLPSVDGPRQTQTYGATTSSGPSSTSQTSTTAVSSPNSTATASYGSITDAFESISQSETTIVAGGVTQHWSKETFSDLTTLTAPSTITTPMVETDKDGSQFTISAAIIIVGPRGVWWNGGTGGFGLHGPHCLWPFCPPGGGGDVSGAGAGVNPSDPDAPDSNEQPSNPNDPKDENQSQSQRQSTDQLSSSDQPTSTIGTKSSASSSSSSSSCTLSMTVSDCAISCASPTGASTLSCATTCSAPITGCSAAGTTQYTTATGDSCTKPSGWPNVADGDDISDYEPPGSADIPNPSSNDTGLTGAGSTSLSGSANVTSTGTSTTAPTSTGTAGPGSGASRTTATPTAGSSDTSADTKFSNPAISSPSSTASVPVQTQKCNVHVRQDMYTDPPIILDANITDASGKSIGHGQGRLQWGKSLDVDSQLPLVLVLTPQTGRSSRVKRYLDKRMIAPPPSRPNFENGPLQFAYGDQSWDTSSSQCSVGSYDNGNADDFFGSLLLGKGFIANRQMDCKFECVVAHSKRSFDVHKRKSSDEPQKSPHRINTRGPTMTDRTPSQVDHDLLEYRALSKRASPIWVKYAASGARYYKQWQHKTGDDAVYQCNFEEEFNIESDAVKKVRPVENIRSVLTSLGYSTDREYYAITLTGPKGDNFIAQFSNTISSSQGVFLANANDRGALPSDPTALKFNPDLPGGRAPLPWQFSTVAWAMWTRTVLTDNPQWAQDPSQADYSGLKAFFRREIKNAETTAILNEAFAGKDLTTTQTWTPEDPDQNTNAFWPLLGSPNGNGMIYILTDNKIALQGKGITSIQAVAIEEHGLKQFTMWANFG